MDRIRWWLDGEIENEAGWPLWPLDFQISNTIIGEFYRVGTHHVILNKTQTTRKSVEGLSIMRWSRFKTRLIDRYDRWIFEFQTRSLVGSSGFGRTILFWTKHSQLEFRWSFYHAVIEMYNFSFGLANLKNRTDYLCEWGLNFDEGVVIMLTLLMNQVPIRLCNFYHRILCESNFGKKLQHPPSIYSGSVLARRRFILSKVCILYGNTSGLRARWKMSQNYYDSGFYIYSFSVLGNWNIRHALWAFRFEPVIFLFGVLYRMSSTRQNDFEVPVLRIGDDGQPKKSFGSVKTFIMYVWDTGVWRRDVFKKSLKSVTHVRPRWTNSFCECWVYDQVIYILTLIGTGWKVEPRKSFWQLLWHVCILGCCGHINVILEHE